MRRTMAVLVAAVALVSGCGDDEPSADQPEAGEPAPVIDPGDGGDYAVTIDPADFSATVDNPYLPLRPGSVWEYVGAADTPDEEHIRVEVLEETREVMGVDAVVVHDVVSDPDGEVIEDTYDWFAQDADGAVWYFGEESVEYGEDGPDTSGSWEAGVDGALPGIVMPAMPEVTGVGYRQEYLTGEAEDMGEVVALGRSVESPAGTWDDTVVTRDWTPLEPDVVEEKTYARDVGLVRELATAGDSEGEEVLLVAVTIRP